VTGKLWSLIIAVSLAAVFVLQGYGYTAMPASASAHHLDGATADGAVGPVMVGSLLLPDVPDCAPAQTTPNVPSPDGRTIARLAQLPDSLSLLGITNSCQS